MGIIFSAFEGFGELGIDILAIGRINIFKFHSRNWNKWLS